MDYCLFVSLSLSHFTVPMFFDVFCVLCFFSIYLSSPIHQAHTSTSNTLTGTLLAQEVCKFVYLCVFVVASKLCQCYFFYIFVLTDKSCRFLQPNEDVTQLCWIVTVVSDAVNESRPANGGGNRTGVATLNWMIATSEKKMICFA